MALKPMVQPPGPISIPPSSGLHDDFLEVQESKLEYS